MTVRADSAPDEQPIILCYKITIAVTASGRHGRRGEVVSSDGLRR
ncbi:hypothetical protein FHX42_000937 [Saccharopolyspora lacisalsi]|uniref:Uncharacterized protein n=1 Tax=Halosaccharopolyspora lacisalsi TaxID=1000566 RepID=A0A839DXY4_9PSEU|nr:hypothetical protein [Halosaccharopolyspora lacisalsi]